MIKPDLAGNRRSAFENERTYGAVRTLLVTYGVATSGYLFTQSVPDGTLPGYVGMISPHSLVVLGLAAGADDRCPGAH